MEVPIVSGDQWHDFVRARTQVRIRGFRENSSGYEFFLDTPQKVHGLSLMIPAKKTGQTVQIDGRPVTAYAKKVRERDYLFRHRRLRGNQSCSNRRQMTDDKW